MKNTIACISVLAILSVSSANAAGNTAPKKSPQEFNTVSEAHSTGAETFGLGVMLGEPTGINGKYWTSDVGAVDMGLAWSFSNSQTAFHIHSDYLFHNMKLFKLNERPLAFYYGPGARLKFENRTKFGLRVPVGLAYRFEEQPIDMFFEVAPIVDLAPSTDLSVNLGIGARYYF